VFPHKIFITSLIVKGPRTCGNLCGICGTGIG